MKPKKLNDLVNDARKALHADVLRRRKNKESHEAIADATGLTRQRVGQILAAKAKQVAK